MRILVAEDDRITRASLARQLQAWDHTVSVAEDGEQAWKLYSEGEFDIVLTDWEMPRLSGLELIQRIRAREGVGFVYTIMLTGRTEKADLVRGIEAGADDFLSKPFDREELRVRLLAGSRIVRLERTLSKQNEELRAAGERMRGDLQAAARVQRAMLPKGSLVTPNVRTAWTYVPTDELAGDAIGLDLVDGRYLIAYVLDVTGHGVPAALLSVTAMHAMSPTAEGASLLHRHAGENRVQSPARVLTELNRRFSAGDNDGRFLTMILGVLDTRTGVLTFSRAGHPLPVLLRDGVAVSLSDEGGLPLGIVEGSDYADVTTEMRPGDRLFFYSDGIIEQMRPADGEQYGDGRFCAELVSHRAASGEAVMSHAVDALAAWAGERRFADDVSLVMIEWLGS